MASPPNTNLYARAGVTDVAEFYRTKFVSDEILDARYFSTLDRFDMRFARTMWVYDNVRARSTVLDLGCGAGTLALLKRKEVTLVGVDLSAECAAAAKRNGYDATYTAQLSALPFADKSFDYVASLDVLGHVTFEEKDQVLAEIKRVLRPSGVTLHGIECIDPVMQKDYSEMNREELRRFISVDGHVGLEEEAGHGRRFARFFTHVQWEPRYALAISSEEFLKQADKYGTRFEADFLAYLRGLSFRERRAFDIAMGYVFSKISDYNIKLPPIGFYTFLKASNAPLGPFYNEHRDGRQHLFRPVHTEQMEAATLPQSICLDRNLGATFDEGWYEASNIPPVARWMRERARVSFVAASCSRLRLDITTHIPDLEKPLGLEFFLNGAKLCALSLIRYGWLELELLGSVTQPAAEETVFELEVRVDRTWRPRPNDLDNRDDRELSIAVCNIEIFP